MRVCFRCPLVFALGLCAAAAPVGAVTYFVHPAIGDDASAGTSAQRPLKSLERASRLRLAPGDELRLAAGQTFRGALVLRDVHGTREKPIVVGTWGEAQGSGAASRARIDARGQANGVWLNNSSHVRVQDLAVEADGGGLPGGSSDAAMRCGVLVSITTPGEFADVVLAGLLVRNVFFADAGFVRPPGEVRTANGTQPYGWGIRFINQTEGAWLSDVTVRNCHVENVEHTGIKFTTRKDGIRRVSILENQVTRTGGPGLQFSGVSDGVVRANRVQSSGSNDDSRKWGRGSGLWTWGCTRFVIERNSFVGANGPADSAGCHIDFNCRDVVVQYNLSARNAGGFCEILGNNHNCAYRYNISVDDGFRVKGKHGAFQEGKTLWLSGYVGRAEPTGPFNSYIYNNTIYVRDDLVAKMAFASTAAGVLIANNIFCVKGPSQTVAGDQNRSEAKKRAGLERVWFRHNLFLRADNWPSDAPIRDEEPLIGDPRLANPGGLELADYVPTNPGLVRDRGVPITRLPGDAIGLAIGLEVQEDILGRPIRNQPDLGAIEVP